MTVMTATAVPSKPKMIILEGVDRTGKGTLQKAINKLTNYKHYVLDRGPIGFKTYCEIFDKGVDLYNFYDEHEYKMAEFEDVLVVYIDCNTGELIRRCLETNHKIIDYPLHKEVYEKTYEASPFKKVKVDSSYTTAEDIAKDLLKQGLI